MIFARSVALVVCALLSLTATTGASADPRATAVLQTEARWVSALAARNTTAVAEILAPNFVHVNYRGVVQYREAALAAVKQPKPYTQNLRSQTVDFAGNAAIVHGINAIVQGGRIVLRLRYTDVFFEKRGKWKAISAQETAIQ